MTFTPLLITTACYLVTAAGFYREGNVGLSVAFLGYSFANFGLPLHLCEWAALTLWTNTKL
jgi:hypothetical protein